MEFVESCVNLTASDFTNVAGLDFHLQSDVITAKCGSSFASAFTQIPLDNIGVAPLPSDPASSPNGNPNNSTPKTVSQANNNPIESVVLLTVLAVLAVAA